MPQMQHTHTHGYTHKSICACICSCRAPSWSKEKRLLLLATATHTYVCICMCLHWIVADPSTIWTWPTAIAGPMLPTPTPTPNTDSPSLLLPSLEKQRLELHMQHSLHLICEYTDADAVADADAAWGAIFLGWFEERIGVKRGREM